MAGRGTRADVGRRRLGRPGAAQGRHKDPGFVPRAQSPQGRRRSGRQAIKNKIWDHRGRDFDVAAAVKNFRRFFSPIRKHGRHDFFSRSSLAHKTMIDRDNNIVYIVLLLCVVIKDNR